MEDNDKKPSTLQKVVENLTHPTTNIREVNFKNSPNDIVLCLITYRINLNLGGTHG